MDDHLGHPRTLTDGNSGVSLPGQQIITHLWRYVVLIAINVLLVVSFN